MTIQVGQNIEKWIPYGKMQIRKGDFLKITATGTVKVQNGSREFDPDGQKTVIATDPRSAATGLVMHALVGVISEKAPSVPLQSGKAFLVGKEVEHTAEADGNLYFIINDVADFFHDNTGSLTVNVEAQGQSFPIRSGTTLEQEKKYYAPDKSHFLIFQSDGNLVVYKGQKIDPSFTTWAFNRPPANLQWPRTINTIKKVVLGADGDLVAYDGNDMQVWHTRTAGHPDAQLNLDTKDGTLYMTDGSNRIFP